MRRTSLALLLAAIALANVALGMKIKGMAFGTGHADIKEIRFRHADFSIADLKRTGVNYVHISAYGNMQTLHDLSYRMGTQDKDIRFAIRRMKRAGLKVFFKPVIEISGEQWRGFLDGKDAWFNKVYIPFITSMARIAQQERVDLFAVGSEYVGSLHNTAAWRRTIHKVRAIYKGTLTYVANHDSYFNVKFWDAVDVISLSAYFKFLPGTYGHTLSLKQTKYLWAVQASKIARWRILNGLHKKKILLAEVGFQSKGRGVVYRVPFLWRVKAPQDNREQAKMYEGLLDAFMPKWWCSGVIFWHWEVKPSAGLIKPYNVGYTPQNKPAVEIMRKYFLYGKY